MKKAIKKESSSTPVNLGTKRTCPKCETKFYDFAKPEIICPKCAVKLDPAQLNPLAKLPIARKAPPKPIEEDTPAIAVVGEADDVLETVDDLGDEDEDLVEDLVEDEEDNEF